MNQEDLEAFAQFLQMSGMGGVNTGQKRPPSFWESFNGKATVSIGLFASSIFLFRTLGDILI